MNTIVPARPRFHVIVIAVLTATVFVGFAKTYYLKWLLDGPPLVRQRCAGAPASLLILMSFLSIPVGAEIRESLPRLEDGRIDLQGAWEMRNVTPLERLPQFKTLVITKEEARARDAQRVAQLTEPGRMDILEEGFDELRIEPVRGELHSSVIVDPPDGLLPGTPLFHQQRAERRAAVLTAFDGPEVRPTSERCLQHVRTAPPHLMGMNATLYQIVQRPEVIVFASEMMHEARMIRMNAQHLPAAMGSWLGDSIGWWEGDTLVVETKYFTPSSQNRAVGQTVFFVSPQTVVTERFTRVSHDELHYRFTVEDPTYYTRPWTGESSFRRSAQLLYESACHEGNYSLAGILRGARVHELRGKR